MITALAMAWLTASLGLFVSAQLLDGVRLRSNGDVIWAGALLGLLQWFLAGPLFVMLGIGTLGLGFLLWFVTRWVCAALLVLLPSKLSGRLHVDGFWPALVTAFIVSLSGSVLRWVL